MGSIIVKRHGDRWAVDDGSGTAPAEEYDTRELAEVAARQLAGGRDVRVVDASGDEQLGQVTDPDVEGREPESGRLESSEVPREPQAGL